MAIHPLIAAGLGLAGFVALLAVVPRTNPEVADDIVSAALAVGYDNRVAHLAAVAWAGVLVTVAAFLPKAAPGAAHPEGAARPRLLPVELFIVFITFFLAYAPAFLTRYGPYAEDQGFIIALLRIESGQRLFTDIEFLYGPLMLFPFWAWAQVFGATMQSYFTVLALQEGLQFAALMAVLQLFLPDRKQRFIVFLLLAPLLIDTLLGPNWSAWRRLAPVFAIVLAAVRPLHRPSALLTGVLLGIHGAYSHDYASAGLAGVGAIYGILLIGPHWRRALAIGPAVAAASIAMWAVLITLLVHGDWGGYLEAVGRVVGAMARGHVSFPFYWTVNSLALFGLLTVACLIAGRTVVRARGGAASGDLLLIGALVFALVTLKSGLGRADHWHLGAAFLGLYFAFLLPLPKSAASASPSETRWAWACMAVASLTYLIGILPSGSLYAAGYVRGAIDVLSGRPAVHEPALSRARNIERERTEARPDTVLTAQRLATPDVRAAPVFYYGAAWVLASRLGAPTREYRFDDLMYSEFDKPGRDYLVANPDAIVVMWRDDYERVFGFTSSDAVSTQPMTPAKRLARWTSTVHYDAGPIEQRLLNRARDRTTGAFIREHYALLQAYGSIAVLAPVVGSARSSERPRT